jgi:putative DNA primase/helicase
MVVKKFSPQLEEDLAAMMGPSARAALRMPPEPLDATEAALVRLARMNQIEYARARKAEAKKLGVPLKVLDDEVEKKRAQATSNIVGAGHALELIQAEPFASPVNVGEILNEVRAFIERFVILTKEASVAVTLWIALSYIADIIEIAPRLAIVSPEPECGKSTLLGILATLCPRVISASNITPSAIFRVIDAAGCATLLMDEIDTFASGKNAKSEGAEAMRGILNSGHSRTTAKVVRTEKIGNSMEARQFSTFAMVAHASIGERIPLTWRSRSVMVRMRRKLRGERTERLTRMRAKQMRADAAVLASKLARMVRDNLLALRDGIPILPEGLPDRVFLV